MKLFGAAALIFSGYLACVALVIADGRVAFPPPALPNLAVLHAITTSPWYFGGMAALSAAIGLMILFGRGPGTDTKDPSELRGSWQARMPLGGYCLSRFVLQFCNMTNQTKRIPRAFAIAVAGVLSGSHDRLNSPRAG